MDKIRRPIPVLVIACLFLLVGSVAFVFHFRQILQPNGIWIEVTEALAIVAGAFMLQGRNWARWLAVMWMIFHVILSAFGALHELAIHMVILAIITWLLFLPESRRYFGKPHNAP